MKQSFQRIGINGFRLSVSLGSALFIVGALVLRDGSDYNKVNDFVSELAVSGASTKVPATISFAGLAVATLSLAAIFYLVDRAQKSDWLIILIAGVADVGAGVFACDAGCPPATDGGLTNFLHALFSIIWFVSLPVVGWLQLKRTAGSIDSLWVAKAILLSAATLGLIWVGLNQTAETNVGLMQRVAVFSSIGWMVLSAWTAKKESPAN